MASEITTRWIFAALQVILGLVAPIVFVKGILAKAWLAAATFLELAYWLGIPAVCFAALALASVLHRGQDFRLSRSGMWGAAAGGYVAFVLPAALWWLTTGQNYRGGGANIGVALLVYAMPLYLPVLMVAGFGIASRRNTKHRS